MSQHRRSRRGKRRQPNQYHDKEEEETVDDLAYAASFAMIGPPGVTSTAGHEDLGSVLIDKNDNDGDDDIDIESDSDGEDEDTEDRDNSNAPAGKEIHEDNGLNDEEGGIVDDDDDDDEVDKDHEELAEAVAAIIEEDSLLDDEVNAAATGKVSHKTQHEVDAYNTPIQELEKHLHFRLTVEEAELMDGTDDDKKKGQFKSLKLKASDLKSAGRVKHHMVEDRTVVIESNPPVNGESFDLLDEGTLLLMKGKEGSSTSNNDENLIPLGRIFETFGPVSRPLYTIRLPEPIEASKPARKKLPKAGPEQSSNSNNDDAAVDKDNPESNESVTDNDAAVDKDNPESNESVTDNARDPKTEKKDATQRAPPVDHWGPNGKYSQLLEGKGNSVAVYFVEDEAKLIDTDMILRNSGKGCDASNLYDEEVSNKDEMYFSDDEKERNAKSRRKCIRKQQSGHQQNPQRAPRMVPRGFHHAAGPNPVGFHSPALRPVPQGFHQPAAQTHHWYPSQNMAYQQYPSYPYPGGNPPPPPPPGQAGNTGAGNNSGPPPAYHY